MRTPTRRRGTLVRSSAWPKRSASAGAQGPPRPAGRLWFPDDGSTKQDLARYYADGADRMLPWLRDRPITMVRYPDGLAGQRFFQKNAPSYFPDWIRRVRLG